MRQNKDKSVCDKDQVCFIYKIQTMIQDKLVRSVIHRYLGFTMDFKVSFISKKLDPHHFCELVQHHQNISDPLQDQLKVGAICQPWFAAKILIAMTPA